MFFRTDFLNLTVCTSAIYMMMNTDKIKRWTFRALVFGIFLSLLYDLFWFMMHDISNDTADGGLQKGIKNFSLTMSYFSFFFRIIVALVFWKDSLDFNRIIKQHQDHVESRGPASQSFSASPDRKRNPSYKKAADEAIAQYKGQQNVGYSQSQSSISAQQNRG